MAYGRTFAVAVAASLSFSTSAPGQSIETRMADASAEAGERVFRQCKACHTVEKDGPNRVGPNLYGVVGQAKASVEGFRYSDALRESGGDWTLEALDAYLEDPRGAIPGNRMTFRGLADPGDRADVIAYLNSFSDAPLSLAAGGGGAETDESGGTTDAGEEDFGLLVSGEGVEETFYACTACHSEMIVVQQGKTREDWDKLFDWMIEEQGMAEMDAAEREIVLDYLAEHYNTDRPNFPGR